MELMKSYCAQIENVNAYVYFPAQRELLRNAVTTSANATTAKSPLGLSTGFAQH